MEKIYCPICGGFDFIFLFFAKDYINHIEGEFEVVRCQSCSLILTNPRPDKSEILSYYPANYQCYFLDESRVGLIIWLVKIFGKSFFLLFNENVILPISKEKPVVLEIGCGGGNFLIEYSSINPGHILLGLDFNHKVIEELAKRGFDVFQSDLCSINLDSAYVDCVYGWMILEHIHCINEALVEVNRVLKKNGKFVFSVPNADSWEFKIFKGMCYSAQIPTHLYHFSPKTVEKLLMKHGFEIERVMHQKTMRDFVESIRIVLDVNRKFSWLKSLLKWNFFLFFLTYPVALFIALLGKSSRITIIAKKYDPGSC